MLTVSDGQTDGRTDRRTDGHYQSISRNCFAIWPKSRGGSPVKRKIKKTVALEAGNRPVLRNAHNYEIIRSKCH